MCVTNTLLRKNQYPLSLASLQSSAFAAPVPVPSAKIQPLPTEPVESIKDIRLPRRRPKRLRKPQKPGKTAKNQERHFVVHNYHDRAFDVIPSSEGEETPNSGEHDSKTHFPMKLHRVLDEVASAGLDHIVSWMPHGRCFVIHKPKEFTKHIMGKYFRQSKLTSFQRQLNLYGFQRITRGKDAGGYYNEFFLRGKVALSKRMTRVKVKGTRYKAASNPGQEPDFYSMPFVLPDISQSGTLAQPIPTPATLDSFYECRPAYPPVTALSRNDLAQSVPTLPECVSPVDDVFAAEPMEEESDDGDVLMSLPMIKSDLFQPLPLESRGAAQWNRDALVDDSSGEELSPEIADFCADWVAFSGNKNADSFEEGLQRDDKLAFMIQTLLED